MKALRDSLAWIVLMANLAMLCALSLQVIRLPGGTTFLPKPHLTLSGTFIDARAWSADDWAHHSEFAQRLVDAGKTDLLPPTVSHPVTAIQAAPASASVQPTTQRVIIPMHAAAESEAPAPRSHSIFEETH